VQKSIITAIEWYSKAGDSSSFSKISELGMHFLSRVRLFLCFEHTISMPIEK